MHSKNSQSLHARSIRAVDERLVHHLSTISVAVKPRTAIVSNIIVPVGICAKKSINLSSPGRCDRVGRTAAWPLVLHPGVASCLKYLPDRTMAVIAIFGTPVQPGPTSVRLGWPLTARFERP